MYSHFGNIDISLGIFGSINKQIDNVIETPNNGEAPPPPPSKVRNWGNCKNNLHVKRTIFF